MSNFNDGTKPDRARQLKNRLIPHQHIINKPITKNSGFNFNRPKTRAANRPESIVKVPIKSP